MRAASPEPSLLSHMRKMGVHTLYSFSQCSDEPKRVCSLARASTALAHAQNGRKYGIFCQSMLRRDSVCLQSSQSVHCSRTCAKWAYIRHIPSVNAQTSLSVFAVFQAPLLLLHMYKMGIYGIFKVNARTRLSMLAVMPLSAFTALAHTQNEWFMAYFISQCSNKP